MSSKANEENVEELLSILRSRNPSQYYTLIRMHLSFATDHATDQCDGSFDNIGLISGSKWNLSPLMRKFIRGNQSSRQNSEKYPLSIGVVQQVFELINFINKEENIIQEGLFRKTGSVARQTELKAALQAGENLNLESGFYSAHDCASVLKGFLADLPEPLLQEGQYHVHCRIAEMCGRNLTSEQQSLIHDRQVKALQLVFLLLPPSNYEILRGLLILLHRVTLYKDVNKMTSLNLGTMFAPHILCPRKMSPNDLQCLSGSLSTAIAFIIENAPKLFEIPLELAIDVNEYFRTEGAELPKSLKSMEEAPTKTAFTFVNRELTAKANEKDLTEMALAELYAYVQTLPDSAKKKKLVHQFNAVNGQGTPKYSQNTQKGSESTFRSIGESIKKHLFSRSVKKSKTKSSLPEKSHQLFKRSNSDDFLSTSYVHYSPDLGSNLSPKPKAKSLENLLSPKSSHTTPKRLWGTRSNPCSGTSPKSHSHETSVGVFSSSLKFTPMSGNLSEEDLLLSQNVSSENPLSLRNTDSTILAKHLCLSPKSVSTLEVSSSERGNLASYVDSEKEVVSSDSVAGTSGINSQSFSSCRTPSPNTRNESNDMTSPITRAMRNFNGQKRVIMTPRSRCPLIINSSSSLSSVPLQEESEEFSQRTPDVSFARDDKHCRKVARGSSTIDLTSPNECSLSSKPNNASSLFGGFFKHLSTSSLLKLASKLSSTSLATTKEASSMEPCEAETSLNESLSYVFKEYLLGRSILTDNPVDLSGEIVERNENISLDKSGLCSSEFLSVSSDFPPTDHMLEDMPSDPDLSKSLLHCLDGNNPSELDSTPKRASASGESHSSLRKRRKRTDVEKVADNVISPCQGRVPLSDSTNPRLESKGSSQSQAPSVDILRQLHSCSPNGRSSSLLHNRNGTPVPQKDSKDAAESSKSVLFETEF